MRHPVEPFKIKSVEAIRLPDPGERRERLLRARCNPFRIPAHAVFIDLLTDSGTGAMSDRQWAALMRGDESYAGARSHEELLETAAEITGYPHILPVHQGRGAEHVIAEALIRPGDVIPANSHFDTTRANFEARGARALDLLMRENLSPGAQLPFKGDLDTDALETLIEEHPGKIPFIVLTLTNNAGGGQPVSLGNVRAVSALAHRRAIPLFIDAARYAENAWFIKSREPGQGGRTVRAIAREIFDRADGMWMSAKKDGLVNIGGLLCLRDTARFEACRERLILNEGFESYGGLAGRDLGAMAVGLREALDEDYLAYRCGQVAFLHAGLKAAGFPLVEPAGGHAVYVDSGALLPRLKPDEFPGQSLMAAFYLAGAVRACEIGSLSFGGIDPATKQPRHPPHELLRLAVPRRVYTESHLAHVIERAGLVYRAKDLLPGMRLTLDPPRLRHFTCEMEPLGPLPEFTV